MVQHIIEEGVFFLIFGVFMSLWQPHAHSREYAFSTQVDVENTKETEMDKIVDTIEYGLDEHSLNVQVGQKVWAEEGFDEDEEDEDEADMGARGKKPQAKYLE